MSNNRNNNTVIVTRNGEAAGRLPGCEIRDGIIRTIRGGTILINADRIAAPHTRESVAAAIKAGRITPEIKAMGMHIGDNGNGLVVEWEADKLARERTEAERNITPAKRERMEISAMYAKAERVAGSDSEDNVWLPMQIRGRADRRLAEWREQYPREAAAEQVDKLRAAAQHQRSLASGALVYDADGWLDGAEQQRRHDEFVREAKKLEAEADRIEQVNR